MAGAGWRQMAIFPRIRFSLRQMVGLIAVLGIAFAIGVALTHQRRVTLPLVYRDAVAADRYDEIPDVSIIQLIATPERFNGKPVRLTGWFIYEPNGTAVYLTPDDADLRNTSNGLAVEIDEKKLLAQGIPPDGFTRKLVRLEGIFDAEATGHADMCPGGGIRDVWRMREMRKLTDEEWEAMTEEEDRKAEEAWSARQKAGSRPAAPPTSSNGSRIRANEK